MRALAAMSICFFLALFLIGTSEAHAVVRLPTDPKVKGDSHLQKNVKEVIKQRAEQEGKASHLGRNVSVTFQDLQMGESRKWTLEDAFRGPSTRNPIYLAKARYTVWIDCQTYIKAIKCERTYECFVNGGRYWQCNEMKDASTPDKIEEIALETFQRPSRFERGGPY